MGETHLASKEINVSPQTYVRQKARTRYPQRVSAEKAFAFRITGAYPQTSSQRLNRLHCTFLLRKAQTLIEEKRHIRTQRTEVSLQVFQVRGNNMEWTQADHSGTQGHLCSCSDRQSPRMSLRHR